MKNKLLSFMVIAVTLLSFPNVNYGQAPSLGTASGFSLFTASGAFHAVGASYVTGDIGTYVGAYTGFPPGTLVGQTHIADSTSFYAAADVNTAYSSLSGVTCGVVLGTTLGNSQVLTPNVYCLGAASSLNDTLFLNAQGNANSLFIIKINGALSTSTHAQIVLLNSASMCNVYWQINGLFTLGDSSVFAGNVIVNGAITLNTGATLNGRGLSKGGDINISAVTATVPTSCYATAPNITAQPVNQTACSGGSVSFSVTATGTALTYQWRKGTTNISGATSATLTINPVSISDSASNYNVVVSGSTAPDAISSNVSLTVNAVPVISSAPTDQTACVGSSAGFSVTATGTALTYQWRKGTTNISGATTASLTINPVTLSDAATNYNVVVSGTCSPAITSSNVALAVNAAPGITTTPVNQTACAGSSASFSVAATGTALTYQWRKGTTNISGATSATLTINPVSISDTASNYNVVVSGTCSPASTSSNVSLALNAVPQITTAPVNQTACSGTSASFSVGATGTSLTYQWRKGTTNISGATSATLTINPVSISDTASNYNVVVSGTCSPAGTSTNVSLAVNTAPSVSSAPTDQTVCAGGSATFSVTATGTALTYQWRKGTTNIAGATTASLTINPVSISDAAINYNVVVSGTCSPASASSNVSLTVNTASSISSAPTNQTACVGSSASFSVVAIGTALTYQWRKGTTNISGATSATLTINPVSISDTASNYNVVVSGTCSPASTSSNVSLVVNTLPSIVASPTDQTACVGSSAVFSVTATGTSLTYQWRKGTTNISGATTASLTINPVSVSDAATNYNVVVSGTCSPASTSSNISLTVNSAPFISSAPTNQTACVGSSATFSVTATGTALTYQWRKGTTNISGATSASVTINPVSMSDTASNYNVVVSGTCSPASASSNVSLAVNTAPGITTAPVNQTACSGSSAGFSVVATGTALTYQWRKGTTNITGATSASLTINPVSISDAATNYNVVVSGTCSPSVTSSNYSLTVNTAPFISSAPTDQIVCAGSSAGFSVTATGTSLTYQWRKGTTNISGATSASLTINPVSISDAATNYNVVVSGTCSPAGTSTNAALTVNTAPAISTAPTNQSVCLGGSATFSVTATGTALTYQWRKGTTNISGATAASLTINPVGISDGANDYNVVISGTCSPASTSSNVSLTVNTAPVITTSPNSQMTNDSGTASFSVTATGSGLTYQWRKGTVNLINGGKISGATSATLTIFPANISDTATNYNVVVTGTCSPAIVSVNVSLFMCVCPTITSAPVNQTACYGGSANFSVVATGVSLTYQWRKGLINIINGANISGATSSTLTINTVTLSDTASNYNVVVGGYCSSTATSSNVSLMINTATAITTAPVNQTICPGGSAAFSVTATGTALTYQWRKGTTNISGATSASLTINPVSISDTASNYNVVVSGMCSPVSTSSNVSLTLNAAPVISSAPTNQTVCAGSSSGFSVTATGTALTYQWRKGTTNISGATSSSLTINPVSLSDAATNYNVVVSGTCSPAGTSSNVSLTVNSSPVISSAPINQTVCAGSSAGFTVTATGTALIYQWRKGTVNISGATSASLVINPVSVSDTGSDYNVLISGTCSPAINSSNVSLSVNTSPVISSAPTNQTVCAGSSASFTVTATGTALTYQWRKGTTNISGATAASLIINPASSSDAATNYNVVVSGTCSPASASSNVSLTVNTAPAISSSPTNQTVCAGSSASFSVTATGTALTYQWRKGTINISGATSPTFTINPVSISDAAPDYNVVVTGTCSPFSTSSNASLNVNPAPSISSAPTNQTVCIGGQATFAVTATGTALTYQWRKGIANISGATSASLIINPVSVSDTGSDYNVLISGTCSPAINSSNVSLAVNTSPVISSAPTNQTVCAGSSSGFSVTATGTALTYQWRKGTTNISGATSSSFTISPVSLSDAATNYNVVVSGTCSPAGTSSNVSLTVNTAPVISSAPISQTVCAGGSASFSVTAAGTAITYQWRKGTIILSGATSPTFTINPVSFSDAAPDYNVVVTGTCSPFNTSSNASLNVNLAPFISTAPTNQTACTGGQVTFAVTASGTALTYQWRKGIVNIPGATSASLTINPVTISDAGSNYNVVISGTCSPAISSSNVSLALNTAPAISSAPANQTVCAGSSASFSVTATGTALTYQWRKGTINIPGATFASLTINNVTVSDAATNYNVVISGTCSPSITSSNASLTVNTAPVISSAPTNQTVCAGNSATFSVGATGTALTYQWRKGTTIISGATSSILVINPAGIFDGAPDYNVVISGTCSTFSTSANVSLMVNTAPSISFAPTNQTVCAGSSASFSVGATGTALTYQWRKGTINISGATTPSLTINPVSISDTASNYNVVVGGTCSPAGISINATLSLNEGSGITTAPVNQTACAGTSAGFSVVATGTALTYQWRKGTANISGATSASLIINNVTVSDAATNYNVVISGMCSADIISADVSLTVNTAPAITSAPTNQTVCAGNSAAFSVAASGTALGYQWRKGTVNISGATAATFMINTAGINDNATDYNVVISSGTCSPGITSANVSLTVNTAPSIVIGPANQSGCNGGSESFWVTATGSGLTYQWRKGLVNVNNGGKFSGANSPIFTISPVEISDTGSGYNVVISGTCAPDVTSAYVSLSLCTETGIASLSTDNANQLVSIYPNPFASLLNIVIEDASQISNAELHLYNVLGEEVLNTDVTKQVITVNTGNLASGLYFYKIISKNKSIQTGRLVSR